MSDADALNSYCRAGAYVVPWLPQATALQKTNPFHREHSGLTHTEQEFFSHKEAQEINYGRNSQCAYRRAVIFRLQAEYFSCLFVVKPLGDAVTWKCAESSGYHSVASVSQLRFSL